MSAHFDAAAAEYDTDFSFSEIGRLQCAQVYHFLPPLKGKKVLEMNGGTGRDALYFAAQGANILTTDISEKMLQIICQKSLGNPAIKAQKWDLTQPFVSSEKQQFDIVFSNFGGWNCLTKSEIVALGKELTTLLPINGQLIVVIMPRFCLWESLYFAIKGKWNEVFRRLKEAGVLANVSGIQVPTYYYSPADIANLLQPNFELVQHFPIGIALPPSYLMPFFSKWKKSLNFLYKVEQLLSRLSLFSYTSDHFYMELRRKK